MRERERDKREKSTKTTKQGAAPKRTSQKRGECTREKTDEIDTFPVCPKK